MFLFFDLKTNGVPKKLYSSVANTDNWPRVVKLTWTHFDSSFQEKETRCQIITANGFEIPEEYSKIHGVTKRRADSVGQDIKNELLLFRDKLQESKFLVAHNAHTQARILGCEFYRSSVHGVKGLQHLCIKEIGSKAFNMPNGNGATSDYRMLSLQDLHLYLFGNSYPDEHTGIGEVRATSKVFFSLYEHKVFELNGYERTT